MNIENIIQELNIEFQTDWQLNAIHNGCLWINPIDDSYRIVYFFQDKQFKQFSGTSILKTFSKEEVKNIIKTAQKLLNFV